MMEDKSGTDVAQPQTIDVSPECEQYLSPIFTSQTSNIADSDNTLCNSLSHEIIGNCGQYLSPVIASQTPNTSILVFNNSSIASSNLSGTFIKYDSSSTLASETVVDFKKQKQKKKRLKSVIYENHFNNCFSDTSDKFSQSPLPKRKKSHLNRLKYKEQFQQNVLDDMNDTLEDSVNYKKKHKHTFKMPKYKQILDKENNAIKWDGVINSSSDNMSFNNKEEKRKFLSSDKFSQSPLPKRKNSHLNMLKYKEQFQQNVLNDMNDTLEDSVNYKKKHKHTFKMPKYKQILNEENNAIKCNSILNSSCDSIIFNNKEKKRKVESTMLNDTNLSVDESDDNSLCIVKRKCSRFQMDVDDNDLLHNSDEYDTTANEFSSTLSNHLSNKKISTVGINVLDQQVSFFKDISVVEEDTITNDTSKSFISCSTHNGINESNNTSSYSKLINQTTENYVGNGNDNKIKLNKINGKDGGLSLRSDNSVTGIKESSVNALNKTVNILEDKACIDVNNSLINEKSILRENITVQETTNSQFQNEQSINYINKSVKECNSNLISCNSNSQVKLNQVIENGINDVNSIVVNDMEQTVLSDQNKQLAIACVLMNISKNDVSNVDNIINSKDDKTLKSDMYYTNVSDNTTSLMVNKTDNTTLNSHPKSNDYSNNHTDNKSLNSHVCHTNVSDYVYPVSNKCDSNITMKSPITKITDLINHDDKINCFKNVSKSNISNAGNISHDTDDKFIKSVASCANNIMPSHSCNAETSLCDNDDSSDVTINLPTNVLTEQDNININNHADNKSLKLHVCCTNVSDFVYTLPDKNDSNITTKSPIEKITSSMNHDDDKITSFIDVSKSDISNTDNISRDTDKFIKSVESGTSNIMASHSYSVETSLCDKDDNDITINSPTNTLTGQDDGNISYFTDMSKSELSNLSNIDNDTNKSLELDSIASDNCASTIHNKNESNIISLKSHTNISKSDISNARNISNNTDNKSIKSVASCTNNIMASYSDNVETSLSDKDDNIITINSPTNTLTRQGDGDISYFTNMSKSELSNISNIDNDTYNKSSKSDANASDNYASSIFDKSESSSISIKSPVKTVTSSIHYNESKINCFTTLSKCDISNAGNISNNTDNKSINSVAYCTSNIMASYSYNVETSLSDKDDNNDITINSPTNILTGQDDGNVSFTNISKSELSNVSNIANDRDDKSISHACCTNASNNNAPFMRDQIYESSNVTIRSPIKKIISSMNHDDNKIYHFTSDLESNDSNTTDASNDEDNKSVKSDTCTNNVISLYASGTFLSPSSNDNNSDIKINSVPGSKTHDDGKMNSSVEYLNPVMVHTDNKINCFTKNVPKNDISNSSDTSNNADNKFVKSYICSTSNVISLYASGTFIFSESDNGDTNDIKINSPIKITKTHDHSKTNSSMKRLTQLMEYVDKNYLTENGSKSDVSDASSAGNNADSKSQKSDICYISNTMSLYASGTFISPVSKIDDSSHIKINSSIKRLTRSMTHDGKINSSTRKITKLMAHVDNKMNYSTNIPKSDVCNASNVSNDVDKLTKSNTIANAISLYDSGNVSPTLDKFNTKNNSSVQRLTRSMTCINSNATKSALIDTKSDHTLNHNDTKNNSSVQRLTRSMTHINSNNTKSALIDIKSDHTLNHNDTKKNSSVQRLTRSMTSVNYLSCNSTKSALMDTQSDRTLNHDHLMEVESVNLNISCSPIPKLTKLISPVDHNKVSSSSIQMLTWPNSNSNEINSLSFNNNSRKNSKHNNGNNFKSGQKNKKAMEYNSKENKINNQSKDTQITVSKLNDDKSTLTSSVSLVTKVLKENKVTNLPAKNIVNNKTELLNMSDNDDLDKVRMPPPALHKRKYRNSQFPKFSPWCTKQFYLTIIQKIENLYGIKCNRKALQIVKYLSDSVNEVCNLNDNYAGIVNDVKLTLVKNSIVKTEYDFYYFCIHYMPPKFRDKAVPFIQPFGASLNVPYVASEVFKPICMSKICNNSTSNK